MVIIRFINLALTFFALAAIVTGLVLWVVALIGVFTRKDLKESKWMWLILIIFVPPIGQTAYFFVENQKKRGIISVVSLVSLPLVITIYALANFFLAATR